MQATYVDDLEHYLRQTKTEPGTLYFAMPITIAKQLVTQIYSSLSQDFFVSNLEDLEKFKQPVLVFSDSLAVVIEIQDNACVKS